MKIELKRIFALFLVAAFQIGLRLQPILTAAESAKARYCPGEQWDSTGSRLGSRRALLIVLGVAGISEN